MIVYGEWDYDLTAPKLKGVWAMLRYANRKPQRGQWDGKQWRTPKGSKMKMPQAFMFVSGLGPPEEEAYNPTGDMESVSMFPLSDYDEEKETE